MIVCVQYVRYGGYWNRAQMNNENIKDGLCPHDGGNTVNAQGAYSTECCLSMAQ